MRGQCRTEGPCPRSECDCGFYDARVDATAPAPQMVVDGHKVWHVGARLLNGYLNAVAMLGYGDKSAVIELISEARGVFGPDAALQTAPAVKSLGGLALITAERKRQIAKGYDAAHDDEHKSGEIITAPWGAIGRINGAREAGRCGDAQTYMRLLTQAAAQIAAEVERVQRALSTATNAPQLQHVLPITQHPNVEGPNREQSGIEGDIQQLVGMASSSKGPSRGGDEPLDPNRNNGSALQHVDAGNVPPAEQVVADAWIDINDRLPGEQGHDSEDVSVFLNGHCGLLDHEKRNGGGWGYRTGFYDAAKQCFRVHGQLDRFVTHWQPLPEPPATATPETKP